MNDDRQEAEEEKTVTKATVSVEEAAQVLGISRGSAYTAVRSGDIPSIRIGKRILIPTQRLDALLTGSREAKAAP